MYSQKIIIKSTQQLQDITNKKPLVLQVPTLYDNYYNYNSGDSIHVHYYDNDSTSQTDQINNIFTMINDSMTLQNNTASTVINTITSALLAKGNTTKQQTSTTNQESEQLSIIQTNTVQKLAKESSASIMSAIKLFESDKSDTNKESLKASISGAEAHKEKIETNMSELYNRKTEFENAEKKYKDYHKECEEYRKKTNLDNPEERIKYERMAEKDLENEREMKIARSDWELVRSDYEKYDSALNTLNEAIEKGREKLNS